jgi:Skp family chaperone for outer membrane proteins
MKLIRDGAVMKAVAIGTMAFGLGTSALMAQAKPTNGGDTGAKVAAINMRAAIANTSEGKQAAARLETEFTVRRKELEDLNKKINDLQQRLTTGSTTLSDEEKQRLTLEGQRLTRQLERRQNEFQEDLNDAQSDVIARIGRRMVEVLGKLVAEHAGDVCVSGYNPRDCEIVRSDLSGQERGGCDGREDGSESGGEAVGEVVGLTVDR